MTFARRQSVYHARQLTSHSSSTLAGTRQVQSIHWSALCRPGALRTGREQSSHWRHYDTGRLCRTRRSGCRWVTCWSLVCGIRAVLVSAAITGITISHVSETDSVVRKHTKRPGLGQRTVKEVRPPGHERTRPESGP